MAIEEKVNTIIAEHLGVREKDITPDSNLEEDLGMDSIDAVELVMGLEDEFNIEIPDDDAVSRKTPGDIYTYVKEKIGNGQ